MPAWMSYKEQVKRLSDRLVDAQRPIRILEALAWGADICDPVLASRFRKPPGVDLARVQEHYRTQFER